MSFRWPPLRISRQHYAALSHNAQFVRFIKAPNPRIRSSRSLFADNCSHVLLCAFQEAFLLKARTDDDSDCTRQRMWETSSEIRKRQRLRIPFPIACAGSHPSRAIFFTVTGLIFRKFAASSGVTNGSLSSAGFIFYSVRRIRRAFCRECRIPPDAGRLTGEQTLHLTLLHTRQYSQQVTLHLFIP